MPAPSVAGNPCNKATCSGNLFATLAGRKVSVHCAFRMAISSKKKRVIQEENEAELKGSSNNSPH